MSFVLPAQAGVVRWASALTLRLLRAPRAGGGGPGASEPLELSLGVLPAQAGVVRGLPGRRCGARGAPRAGGGGPQATQAVAPPGQCSPRRRGWSGAPSGCAGVGAVLPAQAGVVPSPTCPAPSLRRAPRAGGGGPALRAAEAREEACSPRRRGWSVAEEVFGVGQTVLPAQAGVVRLTLREKRACRGAPRAGGGGPAFPEWRDSHTGCSPRRRGWSVLATSGRARAWVLPAQAGVVRTPSCRRRAWRRAPRAGGGGPQNAPGTSRGAQCSPRRRGWSAHGRDRRVLIGVLPAQAGVVRMAS